MTNKKNLNFDLDLLDPTRAMKQMYDKRERRRVMLRIRERRINTALKLLYDKVPIDKQAFVAELVVKLIISAIRKWR